jgi:hypothetical protein
VKEVNKFDLFYWVAYLVFSLFVACGLGCASYTTLQVDTFYSGTNILRQATTRVTIRTILDARSELAKSSVTQASHSMTNVMQYSRIGSISQTATNNIPDALEQTAKGLVEGAKAFP